MTHPDPDKITTMSLFTVYRSPLTLWCSVFTLLCLMTASSAVRAQEQTLFTVGIAGSMSQIGQSVSDVEISKPAYITAWFSRYHDYTGGIGVYAAIGIPEYKVFGYSTDTNHFSLISAGLTRTLSRRVVAYGGLGWAHQDFSQDDENNSGSVYRDYLNLSTGIVVRFGQQRQLSLNLSYDSAPDALGLSISYPFW